MITEEYAIVVRPSLKIYGGAFDGMAKFEVGIAEGKEKALFLTDNVGGRHRIARTVTGDGKQSDFDDAYRIVKAIADNERKNDMKSDLLVLGLWDDLWQNTL